jgi:mRNA interferase MazF
VIQPGDVLLARFPFSDLKGSKLRPAVVLARVPGKHDDYLVAFVSSQVQNEVKGVDLLIGPGDPAFAASGLKKPSLVGIGRVAVIAKALFAGPIGSLPKKTVKTIIDRHVARLRGELGQP